MPKVPIILIYTNHHYQIAATQLFGFGPKRTRQILHSLGDVELLFRLSYRELSEMTGFSIPLLRKMERERALKWSEDVIHNLQKFDIQTVFYSDPQYPRRLKQCEDGPLVLYRKGNLDLNAQRFVAVVGTRAISSYGQQLCEELIESWIGGNICVVSGLAYGVDIAIHRACVKFGIPTIGVLAHGLEMVYPRSHGSVAKRMIEHGALISEFTPFTNPDRENFPMRNRIVAGMCDATIVVESKERGGSLITAELANDYSRDVFAFPGGVYDKNSEGCNQLIADNKAHILRSGAEFLEKMGWDAQGEGNQKRLFHELSGDEQQLAGLLSDSKEMHIDVLALKTGWPVSRINVLLFQMEMNGVVQSLPGNACRLA